MDLVFHLLLTITTHSLDVELLKDAGILTSLTDTLVLKQHSQTILTLSRTCGYVTGLILKHTINAACRCCSFHFSNSSVALFFSASLIEIILSLSCWSSWKNTTMIRNESILTKLGKLSLVSLLLCCNDVCFHSKGTNRQLWLS